MHATSRLALILSPLVLLITWLTAAYGIQFLNTALDTGTLGAAAFIVSVAYILLLKMAFGVRILPSSSHGDFLGALALGFANILAVHAGEAFAVPVPDRNLILLLTVPCSILLSLCMVLAIKHGTEERAAAH